MKSNPAILGACVLVLAAGGGGVRAQTADESARTCQHASGHSDDDIIAACTVFIDSGQGDAETRSDAYGQRGAAYQREKRNDAAIADYRAALKLNPDNMTVQVILDDLLHPD